MVCSAMELIRIGPAPILQEDVTEFVSNPISVFIGRAVKCGVCMQ